MKFVPRSDPSCFVGPRMAMNLLKALMQLDVSMDSITSIWTALVLMKVNNTCCDCPGAEDFQPYLGEGRCVEGFGWKICHLSCFHLTQELSAGDTLIQDGTNMSLTSDDSQARRSNGSLGEVADLMFHLLVSVLLGVWRPDLFWRMSGFFSLLSRGAWCSRPPTFMTLSSAIGLHLKSGLLLDTCLSLSIGASSAEKVSL